MEENQFESVEKLIQSQKDKALYAKWIAEIDLYENDQDMVEWSAACERVNKAYKERRSSKLKKSQYSILWANLETAKPSIFYQMPKVESERRYKDKDPIARAAAQILERATQYCIDSYDLYSQICSVRDDYLKYSRGVVWVSYSNEMEQREEKSILQVTEFGYFDDSGQPVDPTLVQFDEMGTPFTMAIVEVPTNEKIRAEYLHRKNFGHTLGKNRSEIKAVWKVAYLTREELIARFGDDLGRKIPLDYLNKKMQEKDVDESVKSIFKKAKIYEIWDKDTKKVIWLSRSYQDDVIEIKDDLLGLERFFPCAMVYGTLDGETLAPIPDYCQWEGLAEEYNELEYRISAITKALKVTGLYDAVMKEDLAKVTSSSAELALFPIENWAAYVNKNGAKGIVDWFPIQEIAATLRYLYDVKAEKKQQLFEISGQSDLMRGMTDPRETATAQRLKGNYGNLRLQAKQQAFAEFIKDIIEIKAEIIAEIFQDEAIAQMALVEQSPELSQNFSEALELLRNEPVRNYRIGVETDSTIAADRMQDQQVAVEFVNVITQGLNDTLPIIQNVPQLAPFLTETMLFLARRFKAGRALEASIEQGMEQVVQQLQMAQQQPPQQQIDPRIIQSQNEQEARMAQLQMEGQIKQQQMALDAKKNEDKTNIEAAKIVQADKETKARLMLEAMQQGYQMGLNDI